VIRGRAKRMETSKGGERDRKKSEGGGEEKITEITYIRGRKKDLKGRLKKLIKGPR